MIIMKICVLIFNSILSSFVHLHPMKKRNKESALLAAKRLQRKLAMQAGFYDGRFKEKVVKDKKKEHKKKLARKKIDILKES